MASHNLLAVPSNHDIGAIFSQFAIEVFIRTHENKRNSSPWTVRPERGTLQLLQRRKGHGKDGPAWFYDFEKVFGSDHDNAKVYKDSSVGELVDMALDGHVGFVFAYGDEKTGKTHSLFGTPRERGLALLAADELFRKADKNVEVSVSLVRASTDIAADVLNPDDLEHFGDVNNPNTVKRLLGKPYAVKVKSSRNVEEIMEGNSMLAAVRTSKTPKMSRRPSAEKRNTKVLRVKDDMNPAKPNDDVVPTTIFTMSVKKKNSENVGKISFVVLPSAMRRASLIVKRSVLGSELNRSAIAKRSRSVNNVDAVYDMVVSRSSRATSTTPIPRSGLPSQPRVSEDDHLESLLSGNLLHDTLLEYMLRPEQKRGVFTRCLVLCTVSLSSKDVDVTQKTLQFAMRARKLQRLQESGKRATVTMNGNDIIQGFQNQISDTKRIIEEVQEMIEHPSRVSVKQATDIFRATLQRFRAQEKGSSTRRALEMIGTTFERSALNAMANEPHVAKAEAIKVCARMRPLNQRELNSGNKAAWRSGDETTIEPTTDTAKSGSTSGGKVTREYKFDRVYGASDTTVEIYRDFAHEIVQSALSGINCSVFAYGQTSSGKTFTMYGDDHHPGIIPLAVQDIFRHIESDVSREYLVRVAFLEIYNENLHDLLASDKDDRDLRIQTGVNGEARLEGACEEVVLSYDQVMFLIAKGNEVRAVGETDMNARSSRSHTVLRIIIESVVRSPNHEQEILRQMMNPIAHKTLHGAPGMVRMSELNLVDLAGSERTKVAHTTGKRQKEGTYINSSLLALGNVIKAVSMGKLSAAPFRDSKLTRILQQALAGNSRTLMIAAITPAHEHAVESTSTLNFATKVKRIKLRAHVNEVEGERGMILAYKLQLSNLQKELKYTRRLFGSARCVAIALDAYLAAKARVEARENEKRKKREEEERKKREKEEERERKREEKERKKREKEEEKLRKQREADEEKQKKKEEAERVKTEKSLEKERKKLMKERRKSGMGVLNESEDALATEETEETEKLPEQVVEVSDHAPLAQIIEENEAEHADKMKYMVPTSPRVRDAHTGAEEIVIHFDVGKDEFYTRELAALPSGIEQECECTVVMVKPSALRFGNDEKMVQEAEKEGFKVVYDDTVLIPSSQVKTYFDNVVDEPFFPQLRGYVSSGPCRVLVLQRENAIQKWRELIGPANPSEARSKKIPCLRARFGRDTVRNAVSGSSSPEEAAKHLALLRRWIEDAKRHVESVLKIENAMRLHMRRKGSITAVHHMPSLTNLPAPPKVSLTKKEQKKRVRDLEDDEYRRKIESARAVQSAYRAYQDRKTGAASGPQEVANARRSARVERADGEADANAESSDEEREAADKEEFLDQLQTLTLRMNIRRHARLEQLLSSGSEFSFEVNVNDPRMGPMVSFLRETGVLLRQASV